MTVEINKLDVDLFLKLYTSVGWEPPCKEQVERALKNTIATFVAYENDVPVGMVRVIGDGGMSFYIKDFAVIPEYQSKGIQIPVSVILCVISAVSAVIIFKNANRE